MPTCQICHQSERTISRTLGVCLQCIREKPEQALDIADKVHAQSRAEFGLPAIPPDDPQGVACTICVNQCKIAENNLGYCGLRTNRRGKLVGVSAKQAKVTWYHDPLPTNCVGDWVCAGGTGADVGETGLLEPDGFF